MEYQYIDRLQEILADIWELTNEMSPYLLLGFLFAGILHVCVPRKFLVRHFRQKGWRSVIKAAILGVPLPLCSCGVIPTAMGLRKEGASRGAVVSFLISTPQTGVDSIVATYSLMGLPFAIVRPIAAFVTAIFSGVLVTFSHSGSTRHKSSHHHTSSSSSHGSHSQKKGIFGGRSLGHILIKIFRYGFVEMVEDIGKWLIVGLLLAGLITALVPNDLFVEFKEDTLLSMFIVLLISIPMYICATGSIPIAVALMMKGLSPGAALVFLMAGPATNLASMIVVKKVMGWRILLTYLGTLIMGACLCGLFIDHYLPAEWFTSHLVACHGHESHVSLFSVICTIVMILLLFNALVLSKVFGYKMHHHHHHHHNHRVLDDGEIVEVNEEQHEHEMLFAVSGMTCNSCAHNVKHTLYSLESVDKVEVSLYDKVVRIKGNNLSADVIIETIESIGFKAELKSKV